jgi:hypothetical protein
VAEGGQPCDELACPGHEEEEDDDVDGRHDASSWSSGEVGVGVEGIGMLRLLVLPDD